MSENIPYEMQLEIIKKVSDVKSLLRLRSVSKQWLSFIDSPDFIAFYGIRPHNRLLLRYKEFIYPNVYAKYISFIDNDDDVTFPLQQQQQQQDNFGPNDTDLMKQFNDLKVIGTSCGLWCLHSFELFPTQLNVVIWNPGIRKSVGIVFNPDDLTIGFGVCPNTYDPTIVVMSSSCQVQVLTLSSKKMIPSRKVFPESVRLESSSTQVAINRFIYWIAVYAELKNLILSFDLITHEFKEVDLPVSLANDVSLYVSISELNESLVVSADEVNGREYGVWIMGEEGGVTTSFTKLFNIKTPDYSLRRTLLGFRKNGEPIMETSGDEEQAALEVYEPRSENISNLVVDGEFGSFFICPYIETLLLIDHSDGCIISNNH